MHCVFSFSRHMPGHASREILILFGSLTSCDPGDILDAVEVMIVKIIITGRTIMIFLHVLY